MAKAFLITAFSQVFLVLKKLGTDVNTQGHLLIEH